MFLKEMRGAYRNPLAFGFLLLMPFVLIAIISQAFGPLYDGRQTFEVPLVDLDRTTQSEALISELDRLEGITIIELDWRRADLTTGDADNILDNDDYFSLLVIPTGYGQAVTGDGLITVSLYSDPQQEAYAGLVHDQVQGQLEVQDLLRVFDRALAAQVGSENASTIVEEEVAPRARSPEAGVLRLETDKRKVTPANFEQTVPGFALMFTFWLGVFVAGGIYAEKRQYNTWRRNMAAPVHRSLIIGSRVLAYVLIGTAQVLVLFFLGWLIFGLSLGDHPYALLPIFLAMALVTTAFGILMTALIKDFVALNSIMNLVVLLAAAVGGALVPLFLLPDWLRTISPAVPHYWAMDGVQGVMLLDEGLVDTLPNVAALLGFAALFFALGLWRFRFVD